MVVMEFVGRRSTSCACGECIGCVTTNCCCHHEGGGGEMILVVA